MMLVYVQLIVAYGSEWSSVASVGRVSATAFVTHHLQYGFR
jgi:hypothetical protein